MSNVFADTSGLNFDNLSAVDSIDEEDRELEIKNLLDEALNNETFEEDDDEEFGEFKKSDRSGASTPTPPSNLIELNDNSVRFVRQNKNGHAEHLRNQNDNNNGPPINGNGAGDGININGNGTSHSQLLHKKHCPQNHGDEGLSSEIWAAADTDYEQLKTMCEFRERQVLRSEETIGALSKEKRGLSHQIGLMKAEMVQMRGTAAEMEKIIQLRDEEIRYLKGALDTSNVRLDGMDQELVACKEECTRLASENDMLQQRVKLLSSMGTSNAQIEIDNVVRQLREKHAKEIAGWQKEAADLEAQLLVYKRGKFVQPKVIPTTNRDIQTDRVFGVNAATQIDEELREEVEKKEEDDAERSRREGEELFIKVMEEDEEEDARKMEKEKDLIEFHRVSSNGTQECEGEHDWKAAKEKLVNFYEREIEAYRNKLATLPEELYAIWKQSHEELFTKKEMAEGVPGVPGIEPTVKSAPKTSIEVQIQTEEPGNDSEFVDLSSLRKETSSVIIQTEETLETYKILAKMIDQFAHETSESSIKAQNAESSLELVEGELKKLRKRFRCLEKIATDCQKEWAKREERMVRVHEATKAYYIDLLGQLSHKLEVVEIEERVTTSRMSFASSVGTL